jgi:hypothetical protein
MIATSDTLPRLKEKKRKRIVGPILEELEWDQRDMTVYVYSNSEGPTLLLLPKCVAIERSKSL